MLNIYEHWQKTRERESVARETYLFAREMADLAREWREKNGFCARMARETAKMARAWRENAREASTKKPPLTGNQ